MPSETQKSHKRAGDSAAAAVKKQKEKKKKKKKKLLTAASAAQRAIGYLLRSRGHWHHCHCSRAL